LSFYKGCQLGPSPSELPWNLGPMISPLADFSGCRANRVLLNNIDSPPLCASG
jgi:hypothetical protein